MSDKNITPDLENEVAEVFDENTVYATIVKKEDGYHVVDFDGTEGPSCKIVDDGKTIALTKNKSNRQWFNIAKAEVEIAKKGHVDLYYKATKKLGTPSGNRLPNEKLISYLPEAEQAEYRAIIARAIEAKNADKAKPMTEREKLEAKIAKAQAALAKLIDEAAGETNAD